MNSNINQDIIDFVDEIHNLPKGTLSSFSSYRMAYKNKFGRVNRTTQKTYFKLKNPSIEIIFKFYKIYLKSLNSKKIIDINYIENEILNCKNAISQGDVFNSKRRVIKTINLSSEYYEIAYFPFSKSENCPSILFEYEENMIGFNSNLNYVYRDDFDDDIF